MLSASWGINKDFVISITFHIVFISIWTSVNTFLGYYLVFHATAAAEYPAPSFTSPLAGPLGIGTWIMHFLK